MPFARATHGALLCWLPLAAGCSAFFDFSVEQCKYDWHCSTTDDSLQCERGLCVSRARCEKNTDCLQDPPTEAQICVDSRCQKLVEGDCFERFPKEVGVRDNAIVLGAFGPRNTQPVAMPLLNYELAVSELNSAGGLNDRQVLLVVCDNAYGSGEETNTITWGFKHLATALRVPAIVAGLQSPLSVREVFLEYRKSGEPPPFLLVPFAGDGEVIEDDKGLIWYLLNVSDATRALVALTRRIEEGLRQQGLSGDAKVVVWKGIGQTARALWESLEQELSDDAYPDRVQIEANARDALDELVAAKPDIVLVADGEGFIEQLSKLETRWREREERAPIYVLPPQYATSTDLLAYLDDAPAVDPTRFVGVHPRHLGDPQVLERYARRFESMFPTDTRVINGWNYYDAVYYLAYAAFAVSPKGSEAPLTNADIQMGFGKLWGPGDHVEVGPGNIASAVAALSNDHGTITFEGVLGEAAFQRWTGRPTAAGTAVFCLTRDGDEAAYHHEVLVYDSDTERLELGAGQACSELLTQATDP